MLARLVLENILVLIITLSLILQEKKRIMLRLEPPGHENAIIDNYVPIYRPGEFKFRKTEDLDLSKIL